MIICLCANVSEEEIINCIKDGACSVEDIGDMCAAGAGTGCGTYVESTGRLL